MKEDDVKFAPINYSLHMSEFEAAPLTTEVRKRQGGVLRDNQMKAIHYLFGFNVDEPIEILALDDESGYISKLTNYEYKGGGVYVGTERKDIAWKYSRVRLMSTFLFEDIEGMVEVIIGDKNV